MYSSIEEDKIDNMVSMFISYAICILNKYENSDCG